MTSDSDSVTLLINREFAYNCTLYGIIYGFIVKLNLEMQNVIYLIFNLHGRFVLQKYYVNKKYINLD